MQTIDRGWIEKAVVGGAILGGGGGGDFEQAKEYAEIGLDFGDPKMVSLDSFDEEDILVTVSAVGAPSATESHVKPADYAKALELLGSELDGKIAGTITNEMGGFGVVNGLIQSSVMSIPMVDAACNGRAHPTGTMGSMGLTKIPDYVSHQVAVGGDRQKGKHVENYVSGSLSVAAKVIRQAADLAGGLVAVARNPVSAGFVKDHGAVGVRKQAFQLGKAFLSAETGSEMIQKAAQFLEGQVVTAGEVSSVELSYEGGFDVGSVEIDDYNLTFWNEYMTLETGEERIATFPDLIMTLDGETGRPITSANLEQGQRVAVLAAPREKLRLGAGMRDEELLREVEGIIGKRVVGI